MLTPWTQLTTAVVVCTYAIAATAVPFNAPRQTTCDTNPHKIGVLWKGNITGWLGSPKSPHPEKIGLVLDESAAHTFQMSSCGKPPGTAQSNSLICMDCDPSANVVGGVVKDDTVHVMNNITLIAGTPSDDSGWTFDGSEYVMQNYAGRNLAGPYCWYDGTKSELSVSVLSVWVRDEANVAQNCKFVAQ